MEPGVVVCVFRDFNFFFFPLMILAGEAAGIQPGRNSRKITVRERCAGVGEVNLASRKGGGGNWLPLATGEGNLEFAEKA